MHRPVATFLALAMACGVALPAGSQAPTTVHVTTLPIDAGAEVIYAKSLGYFARAGLDVDIIPVSNGGASASAVAGGGVDIGYGDTVSVAIGHGKGVPFVIIAPAALHVPSAPTTELLVTANSPIHNASDLEGKVVAGSALTTISGYSPRAWIDENGGDSTRVRFLELPFPAMQAALEAGRVDAVMIAEPFLQSALRSGDRVLASPYDAVSHDFIVSAYFTTAPWAKAHPDLVARFANVIHETAVWANANHARSAEILVGETKVDPATVAAMTRVRYGERLDPALIQPVVNVAAKYGGITPYSAADLIYSSR